MDDQQAPVEAEPVAADSAGPVDDSSFWPVVLVAVLAGIGVGIAAAIFFGGGDGDDTAVGPPAQTAVIGASSVALTIPEEPPVSVNIDPVVQQENAVAFLNAWRQSRSEPALVMYDQSRARADGAVTRSTGELVQRPPERIESSFGSVKGMYEGDALQCDQVGEPELRCVKVDGESDFVAQLEGELTSFRTYFVGTPRTYLVTPTDSGCFLLTLASNVPNPAYGQQASFCFDAATGVLASSEFTFANGIVDTKTATSIETTVTTEDFLRVLTEPTS